MTVKSFFQGLGVLFLHFIVFNQIAGLVQVPLLLDLPLTDANMFGGIGLVLFALYVVGGQKLLKKRPKVEAIRTRLTSSIWLILGLYGLYLLVQILFPTSSPNQELAMKMFKPDRLWLTFMAIVVVAPIGEEIIFRQVLASYFFPKLTSVKAMALYLATTGLLFSLVHLSATPYQFVIYALMGVLFGLAYLYKQDIRYAIALHALNNLISFVMIVLTLN